MEPIVHGLANRYRGCLTLERVNFHQQTDWHEKISPLGSPEFALLDSTGTVVYRWAGVTEATSFDEVLEPLCKG